MKKIALVWWSNFSEAQMNRLQAAGEVVEVDTPTWSKGVESRRRAYECFDEGVGVIFY